MRVKKCIYCVDIEPAVVVIGFWLCLTLLGQFRNFNPLLFAANLTVVAAFFYMQNYNTAKNREYFFYIFTCYLMFAYAFILYLVFSKTTADSIKEMCD